MSKHFGFRCLGQHDDLRCHRRVQINEVRDPDTTIRKAGHDFQLSTHCFDVATNGRYTPRGQVIGFL